MSEPDATPQIPPEEPQREQPPEPLPSRPDPELIQVVQESDDSDNDNVVWG